MTSRRPTRAEVKRRMAAEKQRIQALNVAAAPLAPEYEKVLATFTPRNVNHDRWREGVGDFVRDLMRRSHVRGKSTFPQLLSEVALYVDWAVGNGYDVTIEALMRHDRIDEWLQTANAHCSDITRSNRRSRLRNLASHVAPGPQAPTRPETIGRPAVQRPYTQAEVASIVRLIRTQPSKTKRRQLAIMVATGLGAGASARDVRDLRGNSIWKDSDGAWWVELSTPPRTVPIRCEYADLLTAATTGVDPEALFIGTNPERKSAVSWVIDGSAITDDHPDLNQGRMRSTWLMNLMCRPVPLSVILQVAGLTGGRTLVDLLPYCQDPAYVATPVGGDVRVAGK